MKPGNIKQVLLAAVLVFTSTFCIAQRGKKQKTDQVVKTGENFTCDFEPIISGIPNYFRIKASKNTDAAVRLIDKKTDKCVRYAFINSGESYDMTGVPEGKYYLKIGLGKEWFFTDSIKCLGEFKQFAIYQKLGRTLDFNIKGSKNNQKIPSHELDLDVKKGKSEPAELIDAKEFQK